MIAIGGSGAFVATTGAQTIAGAKTFSSIISGSIDGNAGTATKLATARTLGLSGDVTGTVSFDGSTNATIAAKGISLPLYGGSEREVSYVSVRVYRWVQKDDDAYALEPAPEVAVFPQMVRLEPQARASVRLAWSRSAPVDERYYRLVLEEFDRPGGNGAEADKAVLGFRVRPKASLPMVIYGRDNLPPAQFTAKFATVMVDEPQQPGADGKPGLPKRTEQRVARITNNGGTYGRVTGFRDAKGTVYNAMVYVLPGSTVDLAVPGIDDLTGLEVLYSSGRAEHVRKPGDPVRSVAIN